MGRELKVANEREVWEMQKIYDELRKSTSIKNATTAIANMYDLPTSMARYFVRIRKTMKIFVHDYGIPSNKAWEMARELDRKEVAKEHLLVRTEAKKLRKYKDLKKEHK